MPNEIELTSDDADDVDDAIAAPSTLGEEFVAEALSATLPGARTYFHIFHVTDADNAIEILKDGFEGGWGDVGFGVYCFGTVASARAYAAKGGWDGDLTEPVILEIVCPQDDVEIVVPEASWPNPDDYADIFFREMSEDEKDENDEGVRWRPSMTLGEAVTVKKNAKKLKQRAK